MSARAMTLSLVAGFAGTAAMATTTVLQRVLGDGSGPIDYDDSRVMVKLAERGTPFEFHDRTDVVVNQLMRFSYGSTAGVLRHLLEGRVRRPAAVLFAILWGGEVLLLRVVDVAPAPWRWKRGVLVTSFVQHAVYAVTTDVVYRSLRGTDDPSSATGSDRRDR